MDENRTYTQEPNGSEKKKCKKGFYTKIIALALCCAILGGVIGGGVVLATGNLIAEKEVNDIFSDRHFSFKSRFNLWPPFLFSFGTTKNFIEDEFLADTYIGVSVKDSYDPEGALIASVEKGGPASKGGLKYGDIITMINNQKIDDSDDLVDFISDCEVGDNVNFTVYRDEEILECTVIVGKQSALKYH